MLENPIVDYHGLLNTEFTVGSYPYYPLQSTSVQPTAGYDLFYCCIQSSLSIQTQICHVLIMGLSFGLPHKRRWFIGKQVVVRQLLFTRNICFLNLDPNLRKSDVCFAGGSLPLAIYYSHEKGVMMGLERSELNASADLISLPIRVKQEHLPNKTF